MKGAALAASALAPLALMASMFAASTLAACSAPHVPPEKAIHPLPASAIHPADNATSPAKVELGRALFWDPVLSGDRDIACATCHHPSFAYTDGLDVSIGVGGAGLGAARKPGARHHRTNRNAMTILDVVWNGVTSTTQPPAEKAPMFWDHRVVSLEEQALRPMANLDEMRGEHFDEAAILPEILSRLGAIAEYRTRFDEAFGPGPITERKLGQAIAAFERTLVDRGSSFDRFMAGDDGALSHVAKRGLAAFVAAGCGSCHSGPLLSDFKLHRLGVPELPGATPDPGAGEGHFRTPSLRNIMKTAPYMHNGLHKNIEDVLQFYTDVVSSGKSQDPDLEDLRFGDGSHDDFMAFFEALSDGDFDRTIPAKVPSGLAPGGHIRP
ncbi:cytochrome-c peroxidase [Pendulispora albinea]|uniref:Cytochrome c domain-containing protein n=1 Tax=Pendulispora albinea TaxID=2741071 RepID=A0ABZ2M7N9_9BACT